MKYIKEFFLAIWHLVKSIWGFVENIFKFMGKGLTWLGSNFTLILVFGFLGIVIYFLMTVDKQVNS